MGIFTCSLWSLSPEFGLTDASFLLGSAVSYFECLNPGVYITFAGEIIPAKDAVFIDGQRDIVNENKHVFEKIVQIRTGGTIDSYWDPSKDTAVANPLFKNAIEQYIKKYIRPHFNVDFATVSNVDSREISDVQREDVFNTISNSLENRFVITHGTFTIPETAKYLAMRIQEEKDFNPFLVDKVIVLCGGFVPLGGHFMDTDAPFNLGGAFAATLGLEAGVYVFMQGRIFCAENVRKNVLTARFEEGNLDATLNPSCNPEKYNLYIEGKEPVYKKIM